MKTNKVMFAVATALAMSSQLAAAQSVESEESVERITVRGAFFGQQAAAGVKTPTLLVNVPQHYFLLVLFVYLNEVIDIHYSNPNLTIKLKI